MSRAAEAATMFSEPLANPSTLDRRPSACATGVSVVLRGGALEPEPRASQENSQAKAHAYCQASFPWRDAEGLSLSGGASIRTGAFQAEHHLFVRRCCRLQKRRRRPIGSPSTGRL